MALQEWELQQRLSALLPLGEGELNQILSYVATLPTPEAKEYLNDLLGDSPEALKFIAAFNESRADSNPSANGMADSKGGQLAPPDYQSPPANPQNGSNMPNPDAKTAFSDSRATDQNNAGQVNQPASFAPPPMPPPTTSRSSARHHTNQVIEAGKIRAQDEVC